MAISLAMRARALLAARRPSSGVAVSRLPVAPAPSVPRLFSPFFPVRYNLPVAVATTGRVITPAPAIAPVVRPRAEPLVSALDEPPQFSVERPTAPVPVVAAEPAALPPVKFTTCQDCGAPVTQETGGAAPVPAAGGVDATTVKADLVAAPAAPGGAPTPKGAEQPAKKGGAGSLLMLAGVASLVAILLIVAAAVRPKS